MTRIPPLPPDKVDAAVRDAIAKQEALIGVVPASLLTMAHRPRLAVIFAELASEVLARGTLDRGLKQLVAYVASATTGCRYCQAHTAHNASDAGVDREKLLAAFEYETSERFDESERAALDLAFHAALVPNGVTDEHFKRLRQYFSDEQVVELVGVVALFGWLNRWNDTMATSLEDAPLRWASGNLPASHWDVGKHRPAPSEKKDVPADVDA